MDKEDRRRFFLMGSVVLEVVTPLFRQRLEKEYQSLGFQNLQSFINSKPAIHILFHLRHRNTWCCAEEENCVNNDTLPLTYGQWDMLFTKHQTTDEHLCHCRFTANPVQLKDLDISLAGLILVNCCKLGPVDEQVIQSLTQFKEDYLTYNNYEAMSEAEYDSVWPELKLLVLQLDSRQKDELTRIENRPLNETLCKLYSRSLLDVYKKMEEMLKSYVQRQLNCRCPNEFITMQVRNLGLRTEGYRLGRDLFYLYQQINLAPALNGDEILGVPDGVLMDDGKFVLCIPLLKRLMVCNFEGSLYGNIDLPDQPWGVTGINDATAAVIFEHQKCVEVYDVNDKVKLKTIQTPCECYDITRLDNKILVSCDQRILIIDHLKGEIVKTIITEERYPYSVHASGNQIYFCGRYDPNILYCYNDSGEKVFMKKLTIKITRITSVNDGSLYVLSEGSLYHMSSDGECHQYVSTEGFQSVREQTSVVCYNKNQKKLLLVNDPGDVNVFHEIPL